ncbi:MAG: RNA polymerase sigma factor [Ktedonobacterales bacterium]
MDSDDAVCISRIAHGDHHALGKLYAQYRPSLYRYLWHYLHGDDCLVEEVLQDTFVAVWRAAFSSAKLAFHLLSTRSSGGPFVLLHFDGHAWARMPADSSAGAPFLDGGTWLAQYGTVNRQELVVGLLLNQGGHWSTTTFPQPVNNVLSARKAPDGSTLVVAATGDTPDTQTLQLLRYANGTWSNV